MKKVISVILIVAMLFTFSMGGAEKSVKLPAKLAEIESEAFSGDLSLNVVDVPYGTEAISSRAFAGSTLTKIYIPSTVSCIADDAFVGTNTVIFSPDFSYAQMYAEQYGFEWEDCGDHYPLNVMDAAADILNSGFQMDETKLTDPELLSVEGETDTERLKLIEEYNMLVLEERELIAVCNDTSALDAAAEELSGLFDSFSMEETDNGVEIFFGSGQLMLDSSLYGHLQAGDSFTDAELSEDGKQIMFKAGEKEYILHTFGDSLYLSAADKAAVSSAMFQSRSTDLLGDKIFKELENYIEAFNNSIALIEYYVQLNLEHLTECFQKEQEIHKLKWKLGIEAEGVYDVRVGKVLEKINGLKRVEGLLAKKLSFHTQIRSGEILIEKWNEIKKIDSHGHPTENDISLDAIETSRRLQREIQLLRQTYCVEALNTIVGLVTSYSTIASALTAAAGKQSAFVRRCAVFLTGASAAAKLMSFVFGVGLDKLSDYRYDLIKDLDRSLHTTVSGKVYDADTKLPLEHVSVVSGGQNVWTNSNGEYMIYLEPGLNNITFKRDDYQDHEIQVTLERGDSLKKDIELNAKEGTVIGVIRDSEFNEPLANVTILCGDRMELSSYDGSYRISLPVGLKTITFMLDDYIDKQVTLKVEENTRHVRDVWMKNKPLEPTPTQAPALPETPASSFGYAISDGEVTIGAFNGDEKDVVIPERIEGYPVTRIGDNAFYYDSLTSVTIPNSVTYIGSWSFCGCENLKSVKIGNNVANIGWGSFSGCSSLMSVTMPDSVTYIDDEAFEGCKNLTSVTIPDSVTYIGESAFAGCENLTSVSIPDSVTRIGDYAFSNCRSLTSVNLPQGLWYFSVGIFKGCRSLTSITIPNSVTYIYEYAFENCSSLTSVTIPEGVTHIKKEVFYGCTNLKSVTIPNSVTNISEYVFAYCSSLTSVTIGNNVTVIGEGVFDECSDLAEVYVSNQYTVDYFVENYPNIRVIWK